MAYLILVKDSFNKGWYPVNYACTESGAIELNKKIAQEHRDCWEERYASRVYLPETESYSYQIRKL